MPIRYKPTKPHTNIGLLGQQGHGKTTLLSVLTKVQSFKKPTTITMTVDELENPLDGDGRGIVINIRHIEIETESRHYAVVDSPTHHDQVKNMLIGAALIDGAILVVSAADGITRETREQVRLARLIGVSALVVFINKMDVLDATQDADVVRLVEQEIVELLQQHGYPVDTPMVRGSALAAYQSESRDVNGLEYAPIQTLLDAIDAFIPVPIRDSEQPFLMPVEDVFSIKGRGTVVTGRVERGTVRLEENVEIVGVGENILKTQVNGLEAFGRLEWFEAGDNAGLLFRNLNANSVSLGMVVATPGSIRAHTKFVCEVYNLHREDRGPHLPLYSGQHLNCFIRTHNVQSTINVVGEKKVIEPGETGTLEITALLPVALDVGTRFALRDGEQTIGAGIVTAVTE